MTSAPENRRTQMMAQRPIVALLDGKECDVEMGILRDICTVAFCNVSSPLEIHEKVLNQAVGVFVWQTLRLTAEDLRRFKSLEVIVKIGSDIDNIDLRAAGEQGIAVFNVAGVGVEDVADSTLSMILNLYRQTLALAGHVRDGLEITTHHDLVEVADRCTSIRGDTLGIVGLGKIGTSVALRAKAFGFKVLFYDPYLEQGIERVLGVERSSSLEDLLFNADCVSLHCGYNAGNREIINEESIRRMRQGVFLVNTAHAGLVNETDLAQALKTGVIQGAAIDVHQCEPGNIRHGPLRDAPNLIVTPHCAYYSKLTSHEMRDLAARQMRVALLDKCPSMLKTCVNSAYVKLRVVTPTDVNKCRYS